MTNLFHISPSRLLIAPVLAALLLAAGCSSSNENPPLVSGVDFDGFDTTVRPQDDFYRYVNGRWMDQTEIPADQTRWGAFPQLAKEADEAQRSIVEELSAREDLQPGTDDQRIGDFFASYMNTARIEELGAEPVQEELFEIMQADSAPKLLNMSARMYHSGLDSPIDMDIDQDLENSTLYTPYFGQSGLTLPDRDYYLLDDEAYVKLREEFPAYAQRLFELANVDNAAARAKAVLDVETKLAEVQWPAADTRDLEKIYNVYAPDDLTDITTAIDWTGFLDAYDLEGQPQLVVAMPSYVEGLGRLMNQIPLDDWKSYYLFKILNGRANYLSDDFVQARFDYLGKMVNGLEELQPRWRRGTQLLDGMIGMAVGKAYVARYFPPEAKARMEALVQNLLTAFDESIDDLEWMTPETKAKAHEKESKFEYKIGYPDKWRDYSGLTITRDDLLGNIRRASEFEHKRNINKLGKPVDRSEWFMTPQTVNAYFNPTMNEIVFPAAILQPPFFNMGADDAVNYGGIGAVIGHEIGHAFDDQGRNFDGEGNMNSWWTEADDQAFKARGASLVEHYNEFEPIAGVHVNGQLTLGENIGDLTGVTIAYRAYMNSLNGAEPPEMDGITGPERFFIGYAQIWRTKYREEALRARLLSDPHSPPEVRVNGVLVNVPAFYEAFNVEPGDGMYLPTEDRVTIW